jgi:hypothetical protein
VNRPILSLAVAALILIPSVASSNCGVGNACAVGAAGTGGEKSEGKAQGFREVIESVNFPGRIITNSGNADAGHLNISGGGFPSGDLTGTFRQNPQPSARGHGTGIFGDWSGQCAEELLFDDC